MYRQAYQAPYEEGFHWMGFGWGLALAVLAIVVLSKSFYVNQSYQRAVVFRLGNVARILGGGPFLAIPFVERVVKVDMRTITADFPAQEMVTQDGLALTVDAVAWYKATDAEMAVTTVADWHKAIRQSAETAIRDVVGRHKMTEILRDRSPINKEMQSILEETTKWGALVEKIEIKNIDLPKDMQRAIAREAEAHREAAARVIKADGELQASKKLAEAAGEMAGNPVALQLRNLQTLSEIGAEKNSVIIMALPIEAIEGGAATGLATAGVARLADKAT